MDGSENTFVFDAGTEFDFFGASYDPSYRNDSEIVVFQGAIDATTDHRFVGFGEADVIEGSPGVVGQRLRVHLGSQTTWRLLMGRLTRAPLIYTCLQLLVSKDLI